MKISFLISLLTFQIVFSQNLKMELKSNIDNKKTKLHVNIVGTKVFIIPPSGFEFKNGFFGNKNNESGIFAIELDKPFNSNKVLANYKEKGLIPTVIPIKIGKYSGIYCQVKNSNNHQKSIDFGDEKTWFSIIANSPESDSKSEAAIIQSLNSIYIDENIKPITDDLAKAIFSKPNTQETDWNYFAKNIDCKLEADSVEIKNGKFPQLIVNIHYKGDKDFPIEWSQNFGKVLWESHFFLATTSGKTQKSTENLKMLTSNIYATDDHFSLFNDVSISSILDFNSQPGKFVKEIFPKKGEVSLQLFVKDKNGKKIAIGNPLKMKVL